MAKMINKSDIPKLFDKLTKYSIYAPTETEGVIRYKELAEGEQPYLDGLTNSEKPPKEVFFPQTEKMLDMVYEGNKIVDTKVPEMDENPLLLFGVRPCDTRAMTVLDKLFTWDYIDPYYMNRRERATTISFSCTSPGMPMKNCFCTSLDGSPGDKEGSDMLWTDLGDKYIVESFTDKGSKILELGGEVFKAASPEENKAAQDAIEAATQRITREMGKDGVVEALEKSFGSEFWKVFSERCLGCGICTMLCPTCHCFDINDVVKGGKGWRERTWDTCQTDHYSVHASGHNPRPEKTERQRNRIYHKFMYMEKNLGVIGCVGCGRCITRCPVNIDIIETVEGMKECAASEKNTGNEERSPNPGSKASEKEGSQ